MQDSTNLQPFICCEVSWSCIHAVMDVARQVKGFNVPCITGPLIHFCVKNFFNTICRSPAYLYSVFHGTEQSAHHLHLQIRMQNVPIVVHDYELMHWREADYGHSWPCDVHLKAKEASLSFLFFIIVTNTVLVWGKENFVWISQIQQ